MTSIKAERALSFQQISEFLDRRSEITPPVSVDRTCASVALILCRSEDDLEILFIQRAADEHDPWSGHIAFPGGRQEKGERVCQTAQRETGEEIGIDLEGGWYLGRLSDIVGTNLPVRVSCCVFGMERDLCVPALSNEVSDVFWARLTDLRDCERHIQAEVEFDDRRMQVPAIRLPHDGKPVLWGITYRLLMQFIGLIEQIENGELYSETVHIG